LVLSCCWRSKSNCARLTPACADSSWAFACSTMLSWASTCRPMRAIVASWVSVLARAESSAMR
jgi:hypothetical protein